MDQDAERAAPARSSAKEALLEKWRRGRAGDATEVRIERRPTEEAPPSPAQRRLWFLQQLHPDGFAYNMVYTYDLEGALDTIALERALDAILRRHEALRTTLHLREGDVMQVIRPHEAFRLRVEDLRTLDPQARQDERRAAERAETTTPFDLSQGPVFRARLLRLAETHHALVVAVHHVAFDERSELRFQQELALLYDAEVRGIPPPLAEPVVQYADHARWQREQFQGERRERQLAYWRRQLADLPPLDLPTDRPRPAAPSSAGRMHGFRIPRDTADALRARCKEEGATLFMGLLAGFQALLHRYAGQDDIAVATPVTGRDRPEVQDLIGFFVNTLVLRTDFAGEPSFRDLLSRVRRTCADGYAHAEAPFEALVEELQPQREHGRPPLFQALFALQPALPPAPEAAGLRMRGRFVESPTSKVDLSLYAIEDADGFEAWMEYSTDLFDAPSVARMAEHLNVLLAAACAEPARPLGTLPLLTPQERARLAPPTPAETPALPAAHRLVEAWARRAPDRLAVEDERERLTYAQLEARADRLARRLRAAGVAPGAVVGLFAERTVDLVAALLGVLKAGAAYLPLDPAYPPERLGFMLKDARVDAILADAPLLHALPEGAPRALALRDDDGLADAAPLPDAQPDDVAYVLYTSGSTGQPKGTPVHHAALANILESARATLEMTEDDRVLALTTLSFDIATLEILLPLTSGASVRVASRDVARDPARILGLLPAATFLQATPATWRMLVEAGWPEGGATRDRLRALSGGEALPPSLAGALLARTAALWNGYGPTEAAIYSTFHRVTGADAAAPRVPIGGPVRAMRAYVLDRHLQPVPPGVPGELCVAGAGVARGYLNRPELTAERFLPDPFVSGDRMYRTGDLARLRSDGAIDFLGRIDRQVKVRGFRIEPGEVEHALLQHPDVRAAVVTARGERLVAYVVGAPGPERLHAFLRARLPEHMVPAVYVALDALPLTPNGKVDQKALPAPEPTRAALDAPHAPPSTPGEALLADAFSRVLGVRRVGIHDDFFALGGHSLLATRLVAALRVAGLDVPLRAVFATPTVAGLAVALASTPAADAGPRPLASRDGAPLSHGQRQMWFLHRFDPQSAAYNMPTARRLRGPLDAAALERALAELVRRHEVLRTTFRDAASGPEQVVHPFGGFALDIADLSLLPEDEREAQRERLARAEAERPFDLGAGPVFRARLLRLAPDDHVLLLTVHHAAFDETSDRVLLSELGELYAAFAAGRAPALADPPLQYGDYAAWQRERAARGAWGPLVARWRERLQGVPPLDLPADRARPATPTQRGSHHRFALGRDVADALWELARAERTTPYAILLAAYQALLHRHAQQDDFAVGTPVAARGHPSLEDLIGDLVNTVAMRADLSGEPTFRELVARTRERTVEAHALAEVPFELVVEELQPTREAGRTPLFQAFFAYEARQERVAIPGLSVSGGLTPTATSKFDLSLFLAEEDEGLSCWLESSLDLFEPDTAARLARRFETLLRAALARPDERVARLPLMPEDERDLVLGAWSARDGPAPEACVHELVARQAARTPDALAVDDGVRRLTYAELDARSDRIARALAAEGVAEGSLVAVRMERSADLVAALLGVLKSGAAYVPLDPSHPEARLAAILDDTAPGLVLTDGSLARLVAGGREAQPGAASLGSPAYVLHTSGSTGRPKGVVVGHRALSNLLVAMHEELDVRPADRWLAITTVSFDIAALEIFLPLARGASVRLATREEATDPQALAALAAEATLLQATPPTWRMLVDSGWPGQPRLRALSGGEALPADLARRLRRRVAALWNVYGPTETTIWSTLERVERDEARVPIGRPLANTRLHVVDARGEPVPPGVPGELLIGGLGVADGYLARPQLTAERFVPDPFAAGSRVYRTGDLVRWRADGRLEHLGRIDRQVKVRGVRVELGEIEHAMREHPLVREAVAALRPDASGDPRLVGYLVAREAPVDGDELGAFLRGRLPEAMVPSLFVPMERVPLTPNGKVDASALPDPVPQARRGRERVAPRTPAEEAVAALWRALLGVEAPGIHDDFFALGGHSLLATQLASRIRADHDVEVPLRALFAATTLEGQARLLEAGRDRGAATPGEATADAEPALSSGQERMLFLHQLDPDGAAYNMALARRLRGPLDVPSLERALSEIVRRHAPLRTTFTFDADGRAHPVAQPPRPLRIESVNVPGATAAARECAAFDLASIEAHAPFDLSRGPLLRPRLYRLGPEDHLLVVALHHVAFDEWSERVLLDELRALYAAFHEGRAPDLPPLPTDYARHAGRQRAGLAQGRLDAQIAYWRRRLAGLSPLDLPTDRTRPAQAGTAGGIVSFEVPAPLAARLRSLCRGHAATPFMGFLAAFHALLHRYSGQEDIAVGSPISGRTRAEVEELVGFFANTLVLRTDLSGEPTFAELLARVREASVEAYANQEVPFERLVDELAPTRDPQRTPLFQVAFLHQGEPQAWALGRDVRTDAVKLPSRTAKFELTLGLTEHGEGLAGFLEYRADLFERATAERMARHYVALLDALAREPDAPIARASLLTPEDARLLAAANATAAPFPDEATIHALVEAQAARTPDAIALRHEGRDLTYAELDARANRLARHLAAAGVEAGHLVGLCARRGIETHVAILAILKRGAAYLPLDPSYPRERLAFMVEDASPSRILAEPEHLERLGAHAERCASLVEAEKEARLHPSTPLDAPTAPRDLAYVIYTSGSTGRPKGVLLEHRGACNLAAAQASFFGLAPGDRVLQFASLSFDASVWEILMALTTGATLVIPPRETVLVGDELARILADERISIATLPPSALATLPDAPLDGLRTLVVAGEACAPHLVAKWRRGRRFVNAYGPTESTVCATWQDVERDDARPPPIGRPLPNLEAHVLDAHQQPTPVGVPGELYVGGVGLARGYLRRPDLTAERFLPHPTRLGERLYRTGDVAKRLADGGIEFLGRVDHQVKIRGFRIELGEVEAALLALPGVREAVSLAREDTPGEKRLVAYVAPATLQPAALREQLGRALPVHMVPAAIVPLEALPLTSNGKVDRKALPTPESARLVAGRAHSPPTTPTEALLCEIWQEVLRVERVGIHDNFFELGGDSILSIQVVARAARRGVRLATRDVFHHQTVAALAAVAAEGAQTAAEQGPVTGDAPLTPIQKWFFARDLPERHQFNQSLVLSVAPGVEAAHLEDALRALLLHHDALRLRFAEDGNGWRQTHATVEEVGTGVLVTHRLEGATDDAWRALADEAQASLDPARGRLVRAVLADLGASGGRRLLLAIHHLAVDVVSWSILLEDLDAACRQRMAGETVRFPPKTTSFRAWAERIEAHAGSDALRDELSVWRAQSEAARLPRDRAGANLVAAEEHAVAELSAAETEELLREVPRAYRAHVQEALVASLAQAVARWTGRPRVVLEIEGHGREDLFSDVDLSRTVGWFTTLHPLALEAHPDDAVQSLRRVKRALRQVPHRGIGHGLLRQLGPRDAADALASAPSPEISFNYMGQLDGASAEGALFRILDAPRGREHAASGTRHRLVEVNGGISGGRLLMRFAYSRDVHDRATLERVAADFVDALRSLVVEAARTHLPQASDFPLAKLDETTLGRVLDGREGLVEDLYPLTPMQQGMLFHSLREPGSGVYVEQTCLRLAGPVDAGSLRRAWQLLVDRHDVLRAGFAWTGLAEPLHVVHRRADLPFELLDWSDAPQALRESRLDAFLSEDRARGFALDAAPLLRITLVRFAADDHRLVWTNHHTLLDGWSLPVVLREVALAYDAFRSGASPSLPPARPFRDFVAHLRARDPAASETFWRGELAGFDAPTPLGIDHAPRPERAAPLPSQAGRMLPPATMAKLDALARRARVTPNAILQGAWGLLLARYSGRDDVVFGATVAGRPVGLDEVESRVGLFINTLPVRVRVPEDVPVAQWLADLQAKQAEQREHEHASLVDVRAWSALPAGAALFDSLLVFENYPWRSDGLELLPVDSVKGLSRTNFPLALIAGPGERLTLTLHYDPARFEDAAVARMLSHLERALEALAEDPDAPVGSIDILTAEDTRRLDAWAEAPHTPAPRCVHEIVAEQAGRTPDALAVDATDGRLTYRELEARSDAFARVLLAHGARRGELVALAAEPGARLVAAMLGVLKAGAAYVPIDPAYPPDRIDHMLRDSGARLVLTQTHLAARFAAEERVLVLLDAPATPAAAPTAQAPPAVTPDDLAYVIYTSGSTGLPKGVLVEHRGAASLVAAHRAHFRLGPGDRVLQFASWSFDAAFWEGMMALGSGATLCIPPVRAAGAELQSYLEDARIHAATLTPSALKSLQPERLDTLHTLVAAGEELPRDLAEAWARGRRLFNAYGPTETTVCATLGLVEAKDGPVTIGGAFGGARVRILDARLRPVPPGHAGEICVGGAIVARGYRNRAELTAERFVSTSAGERVYRTGDLARWREDGRIEFLGRLDQQVKVRGYRIEPGEVETALRAHPQVHDACVVARPDALGETRLVAYVVAGSPEADGAALREHLARLLPPHMLPSAFVPLEALPQTPNGKVDRKALPDPEATHSAGSAHAPPRDPIERILVGVWKDSLGLQHVGIHDDFFLLGGHSLNATRVASRIRESLGVEMPLRTLFAARTIEELAREVRALQGTGVPLPPIRREDSDALAPLSFAQQRLWFLSQWEPGSAVYNIPAFYRLAGPLDTHSLERALGELTRRHDILRTVYALGPDGRPVQHVQPHAPLVLERADVSGLADDERPAAARRIADEEARRPYDLARGPVFRAKLVRVGPREHWLLLGFHHIAFDGWSVGVLLPELGTLYRAYSEGAAPRLPELPVQYADFARWQRAHYHEQALAPQMAYWRAKLARVPVLDLPVDKPRPKVQTFRGAHRWFTLPETLLARLQDICREEGATLFMGLLAAYQALLHRYTAQTDFAVGTPISGRTRAETEGLIGFFVNTLVLRADISGEPTFRELLRRVRQTALDAYAHQDVPFERLVAEVQPERDTSRSPLFQTMFVLQDDVADSARWANLQVSGIAASSLAAKFDLTLFLANTGGRLEGIVEYRTDLFESETIDRFAGHLETLLASAAHAPDQPLARLEMLAPDERERMLVAWNRTDAPYERNACLHELIEAQAQATPDAPALLWDGRESSYAALAAGAARVRGALRATGVRPGDVVGLVAERSPEAIAALLGILQAGATYLPLDPRHPPARLAYVLEDARARLVLVSATTEALAPAGMATLRLDALPHTDAPADEPVRGEPELACYVIYTSGSTGQPKGVVVEHRNACNLVLAARGAFGFGPAERVLQFASPAFDGSIIEIVGALATGACLVLPRADAPLVGPALQDALDANRVTVAILPPAAIATLPEDRIPHLRTLVSAGEALPADLAQRWASRVRLLNAYGPTECTVGCASAEVAPGAVGPPPLGRPFPNARLYVLDAHGAPVPAGVAGELHIGGAGVARGYLRRDDLTRERFLPDPFHPGGRMYRTGDLVRWRADGQLEFLGRLDEQVKIRGFRIELGEIEAALKRHASVREASVMAREDHGHRRLVAYVVAAADATPAAGELREHLAQTLPEHMLPAAIVMLDALPLTPNGKVDRKALPAPEASAADARAPRVAPRTPTEEALAEAWRETLRLGEVGVEDNFFELGGDSILSITAIARAAERGVHVTPKQLFEHQTIAGLARALAAGSAGPASPLVVALQPLGARAPLFCVHPVGGGVACYRRLAQALGTGRPFLGIQAPGLESGGAPREHVHDIARAYLDELRRMQPAGPYHLSGWSFGALVAHEMARQLADAGERVETLLLLDPPPPRAPEQTMELAKLDYATVPPEMLPQLGLPPEAAGVAPDVVGRHLGVLRAHVRAHALHRPARIAARAMLVVSEDSLRRMPDVAEAWRAFVGPLDVAVVPGDHNSIMTTDAHVRAVAAAMARALAAPGGDA